MKYSQFIAFEKHLEAAKDLQLVPVYSLIGKDVAERRWAFDALKKIYLKKYPSLDYREYDQEQLFLNDISTKSFFTEARLLLFSCGEKLSKKLSEVLEKKMTEIPPLTTLVFLFDSLAKTASLYKAIEKLGVIYEMGEEKPWEKDKGLSLWLMNQASLQKKQIAPEIVNTLVRGSNKMLSLLASEWEKLLIYVGERPCITLEDVKAITVLIPEDNSWGLGEAVMRGDLQEAAQAFKGALNEGQSLLPLIRQMRYQFTTALNLVYLKTTGQEEVIQSKYPYLKGPMLTKQLTMASKYGMERLEKAIFYIDQAEFQAKDAWDPHLLITYLLGKL